MSRTSIILLLKLGKDLIDPDPYWPISPLEIEVKILTKVLTSRWNEIITSIIHPDQAGFMPHKSKAIDLRKLFINMQTPTDNKGQLPYCPWPSLDLERYISPVFTYCITAWQQMTIRESCQITEAFDLGRGNRQRYSLSPLLFTLAIEPLAALIRSSQSITVFCYSEIHEKIMLYAGDTLLLLGNTSLQMDSLLIGQNLPWCS